MPVEFQLLGDIGVYRDREPLDIGYAQLRCVLAVLLLEANRPVPVDQIVDRVWGNRRLPRRPNGAVQHSMTMLRHALATAEGVRIGRHSAGYQLTVDPETVDVHRFRGLLSQAQRTGADDERTTATLASALELWRGEPFTGLDTPWLNAVRATLHTQRHAAQLDLNDRQLRQGRHAALLADLADQVHRHPLDERLAGQYLLALYRAGRQADALAHHRDLHRRLADELGVEPSPPLQRLHQQILAVDPTLLAGSNPVAVRVVPRQLPPRPRRFVGRVTQLAQLDALLGDCAGPGPIAVVCGVGGAGKTSLGLRWAHQNLARFPDGQLYANLRGFDPVGQPTAPETVVRGFLDALGVADDAVPAGLDAQVARYRSLVADKQLLVVLDNAWDSAQVAALLPGGPRCAVLVTSRRHLAGLITAHGAVPIELTGLSDAEAGELLTGYVGAEVALREPAALAELVRRCAGLALALCVVGTRVTSQPGLPLHRLVEQLRTVATCLDALDGGELTANVRAALSWSYTALDPAAAELFGLLGLAPGPDIGLAAAAALGGLPADRAQALLTDLEHAHLVEQHLPGRWRTHDLVRCYAAERAGQDRPAEVGAAAVRRVLDHYLGAAYAADRCLAPTRRPIEPVAGTPPGWRTDLERATAWLAAEHAVLVAAVTEAARLGWHAHAWQLAWCLLTHLDRRQHGRDLVAVHRIALVAAGRGRQLGGQAVAWQGLGRASYRLGQYPQAHRHYQRALLLFQELADQIGQAEVHAGIAMVFGEQDRFADALRHAQHALELADQASQPAGVARGLNQVGWYLAQLGRYREALPHCERALDLHRALGDREEEAHTWDSIGYIQHHLRDYASALAHCRCALALWRELGDRYFQALVLDHLGDTHCALGNTAEARWAWQLASAILAELGHPVIDRVRPKLL